jgi:hypothetical protein
LSGGWNVDGILKLKRDDDGDDDFGFEVKGW